MKREANLKQTPLNTNDKGKENMKNKDKDNHETKH